MFLTYFYNNGQPGADCEHDDLDVAFDAAVTLMRERGYSACYIYNSSGTLCLHLNYSGLFGEKD